jgi:DNA-binding transcriptional ArsR family regulator
VPRPSAEKRLAQLNAVLNALAHPARRQILMTIHFRGGEMAAGEIAARFRHSWPTTTRHLGVLEAAGLVTVTQEGRGRKYQTSLAQMDLVREWLQWFGRKPARD